MVTMVLLNEAWMWAIPCGTCFRSFFLKVFFLPFLSGAAAPVPAAAGAAGFAIVSRSSLVVVFGRWSLVSGRLLLSPAVRANDQRLIDQRLILSFRCRFLLLSDRSL